jgi:hypothetical protein
MKLIFIYGPPAVGKTTIGSKLAKLTGYKFFFNHLTVPAVKALFPGHKDRSRDEEYWQLLKRLRFDTIETAADAGIDTIFTVAYQGAIDDGFVDEVVDIVTSRGGEVHFVQLIAPKDVLVERVSNKSRKDFHLGKMTTPAHLNEALHPGMYEPVKYKGILTIDTSKVSAVDAAAQISDHFRLTAKSNSAAEKLTSMRVMKALMILTDIGFIAYWLVTLLHLIPAELLFRDYTNLILVHWNWSFLPLDLAISATGLTSVWLYKKRYDIWRPLALISLTLTFVSGLQAIAFWVFAGDFNMSWWLPNLFLLIYPLCFISRLVRER